MQLIGQGAQYNVFDTADGRVLKRPLTQVETFEVVKSWYDEGGVPHEKLTLDYTASAITACTTIRPRVEYSPQLSALLGHPQFARGAEYTQDKVRLVGELLATSSEADSRAIIDSYIQCIIDLWSFGLADRVYNPTINNGVNDEGHVILIDFGEVTFEKQTVAKRITKRRWLKAWSYNHDIPEHLREYYAEQMKARLTLDALEDVWGQRLNQ